MATATSARLLGADYLEWLKDTFHCGIKDHCVYWFRKANDHLQAGQRAGLVGTNSIAQNRARSASLNYIAEGGGVITNAVSTQPWPGEAVVEVAIVNWVKAPDPLPGRLCSTRSRLMGSTQDSSRPRPIADVPRLPPNRGKAYQGFLAGAPFDIGVEQAADLLNRSDADYSEVVKPYLDSRDIARTTDQRPSRFAIDFGQQPLE